MSGDELVRTLYSMGPIFAVPAGRMTFWLARAVETSKAESPLAKSASGSRSTMTDRALPPHGSGTCAPWTVASWVRMKLSP
jgi:hypothetical protein